MRPEVKRRAAAVVPGLVLLVAASCRAQEPAPELAWMAGCWVVGSGETRTEELWTAPGGGILLGLSRTLRPGRPAAFEFLRIETTETGWAYRASPAGRPPTTFPIVTMGRDAFRAELAEHDFPKAIEYVRIGPDSLTAHVYGELGDDADPAFSLPFARGACPGT